MGWRVWGIPFESGELSNTSKYVSIKFNKDMILKAIRTWIIVYNDPTFTSLNMKIYSCDGSTPNGTPIKLLATSTNALIKSDVHTLANGVKEVWFEFNDLPVNGNDYYNVVLNGVGYVPTANSHLAWMQAFPDPVYRDGLTINMTKLNRMPYALYVIGGEY